MQATTFDVSDKLTLASTDTDTDSISTTYDCNVEVQLAGDSAWDCELEAVTVTSIHVFYRARYARGRHGEHGVTLQHTLDILDSVCYN